MTCPVAKSSNDMTCPVEKITGGQVPHVHSQPQPPSQNTTEIVPIPEPPQRFLGLLGNLPDIDPSFPIKSFWHFADLYGPILKLGLGSSTPSILLSNQKLINEICDQDRFEKCINEVLQALRPLLGDGLFTAYGDEENWWKAHRLLVPAFGPLGIRNMFDDMLDISSQMVLKWDRQGPDHAIDCSDDLTRLAFDTIGLCSFGYRFNEFYLEKAHPFAQQMADVLLESGRRANRPSLMNQFYRADERERQENVRKMHELSDEIIAERKRNPQPDSTDLLNTMLNTVDRETGEALSDENIRFNMCTFLVAGHETTSGTLSFCYYNLLKNPAKLLKAQKQVDEVVGNGILEYRHLAKLTYIDACIKETLRLSVPIPVFVVNPKKDTVLGGKYFVSKDSYILANLKGLHYDKEVWGDDVDVFRPERMLDGGFQALPPNSWKPFGNGMRACIGRAFAEQEMVMNVALVLQRFQIELADPTYELQMKSTLTIKPVGFYMKVRRRPMKTFTTGIPSGIPTKVAEKYQKSSIQVTKHTNDNRVPFTVFFGGNTGTCESLAQDLETGASDYGLEANVRSLDSATENLPVDQPVVIITASYEGKPPDNSRKFVTWLEQRKKSSGLKNVNYSVFGVGNSDWASTFHRIPKLVDKTMGSLGATCFLEAGYTNVKTDVVGPWEDWKEQLWEALCTLSGTSKVAESSTLSVAVQRNPIAQILGGDEINMGTVIANADLASTEVGPAKKHMVVKLPEGKEYVAGDYLLILPRNSEVTVRRVLTHFRLTENDIMTITGSKKKFLLADPMLIGDFLFTVVELNTPITKRQVETLIAHAASNTKCLISEVKEDAKYQAHLQKRYSIIDTLEEYKLDVPFSIYVEMLQPLTPRPFSISSSPLHPSNRSPTGDHVELASITYDILEAPAFSGHGMYHGAASTFLASRQPGEQISCFIRSTQIGFRLPSDETPIIMIAAGSGIAPMRAFIQERAAITNAGMRKLGPAILFFGCRHEDKDYLYKNELREWEAAGVVVVKPAFSRMPDSPKHVQDLVWENRDQVWDMFKAGGKIFLCGSAAKLGRSAAEVCKKIYRERTGDGEKEADEWLERQKEDRYISDTFG